MADTKFMDFAEVTPIGTDSVLVGNATNGVRRAQISNLRAAVGSIIEDNISVNGFVKFANGLTIQWGGVVLNSSTKQSVNVDFSTSFDTAVFCILMTPNSSGNEDVFFDDKSNSGFRARCTNGTSSDFVCKWLAIGI